ncbi:hypothetical protein CFO_g4357 [Ceratocystis platani]|uniref:Uncharacterized protein n=1 Tax=Ceratocystis fimbriata f. sp. platani TaxID=88771 RepID=A0A0F8AYC5_CERFI|nr:hypothetical protein CFO_g4357 [Ceratocystis platani]
MRATTLQASVTLLGLFFSLSFPTQATAALTNANLAPNDVPLICIDICGPMVELSSACQIPVDSSPEELRLLRRELDAPCRRASSSNGIDHRAANWNGARVEWNGDLEEDILNHRFSSLVYWTRS